MLEDLPVVLNTSLDWLYFAANEGLSFLHPLSDLSGVNSNAVNTLYCLMFEVNDNSSGWFLAMIEPYLIYFIRIRFYLHLLFIDNNMFIDEKDLPNL